MTVTFVNKGSVLVISIAGELDQHSADYIRQKIDAQMIRSTTRNIVFDLSKISFMDSSGIGVIMGRFKNIQQLGGKAALAGGAPQIRRIFEMAGILRLMPIYEDMNSAVSSF